MFSSRVNFVCLLLLSVRSTPVLPLWHVKQQQQQQKPVILPKVQVEGYT